MSTDGGPEFTCKEPQNFLKTWGVRHRLSSAYFPHSNCCADLGVKSGKRLLRENTGPKGELNTDKLMRALLQYRNTPDQDTGLSPAQVIFGHEIRDFVPVPPGRYAPRPEWALTMEDREKALMKRHVRARERLTLHTKTLQKLQVGDSVLIQNQTGNHARKWDRTGKIMEVKDFDQYLVKVDDSGRVSLRNRKFLQKFVPYARQPAPRAFQSPTPEGPGLKVQAPEWPEEILAPSVREEDQGQGTEWPAAVLASTGACQGGEWKTSQVA